MKRSNFVTVTLAAALMFTSVCAAQDKKPPKPEPAGAKAPAVSEENAKKAGKLFEQGRELFFQGQYKDAAAKLADAVKTDPTRSSYKLLLAKAHRYAGQTDEAVKLLEQILKENPEHVEAGVTMAELLSPTKQPDRVIEVLEPLLKFKHDYPLYHLLAEAYYEKEQLDKARKHYEEAVKLNPRSGGDFYQLGNIYFAQGRFAKAARAYERAGALGIDSDVYHFKLASVYFQLRNYLGQVGVAEVIGGKVGQIKDQWLLIDPVPGQTGKFYAAGPRSAAYQVVKAREMGIKDVRLQFLEANVWLSARRYGKADGLYKALEGKLEKTDQGLFWFYWARTALGLDQYEVYLERLNKAIEAEPQVYKSTLADAYVTVADRYHQRGNQDKYVAYLSKAVQTNPLSASLHLTLGDAWWQKGDRDKAVEQYKLVLELEPDHAARVRLLNRIRGEEDIAGAASALKPPAPRQRRSSRRSQ